MRLSFIVLGMALCVGTGCRNKPDGTPQVTNSPGNDGIENPSGNGVDTSSVMNNGTMRDTTVRDSAMEKK